MAQPTIITNNTAFAPFNVMKLVKAVSNTRAVAKQRRDLSQLSDTQLSDIGITNTQRDAECSRRFWA